MRIERGAVGRPTRKATRRDSEARGVPACGSRFQRSRVARRMRGYRRRQPASGSGRRTPNHGREQPRCTEGEPVEHGVGSLLRISATPVCALFHKQSSAVRLRQRPSRRAVRPVRRQLWLSVPPFFSAGTGRPAETSARAGPARRNAGGRASPSGAWGSWGSWGRTPTKRRSDVPTVPGLAYASASEATFRRRGDTAHPLRGSRTRAADHGLEHTDKSNRCGHAALSYPRSRAQIVPEPASPLPANLSCDCRIHGARASVHCNPHRPHATHDPPGPGRRNS